MKSRIKYEAVATIGKYKDRVTGEEKKQFAKVGTVFEAEDGRLSLKLDTIPVGPGWSGFISFYPPKPRDGQAPRQSAGMPPAAACDEIDDQDDVPF